jgi:hypothetical protein
MFAAGIVVPASSEHGVGAAAALNAYAVNAQDAAAANLDREFDTMQSSLVGGDYRETIVPDNSAEIGGAVSGLSKRDRN